MKNLSHMSMLLAALWRLALLPWLSSHRGRGTRTSSSESFATPPSSTRMSPKRPRLIRPVLGCVSGSDHGAMGIHYVNTSLLNGPVDATQPQALIYEPTANGQYKLVGVEFILLASALPPNAAPQLEGHLMLTSTVHLRQGRRLPRTVTAYLRSSNSTFGRGGTTPRARSWTGTTM